MQEFDYIIAGAGAAGCVLAYRLSEDPSVSVALLEAGGEDKHPLIHMPKGLGKLLFDPNYTWQYRAEPEEGNGNNAGEYWARGKVMGGSSSTNGLMYVRGQPGDFNEIAALSSEDWAWPHIGAAYKALESHELGAAETRGAEGPLKVTLADRRTPLTDAFVEAGVSMGLKRKEDVNAPDDAPCVGYASRTIHKGKRQSASKAFIDPIRGRQNLTIITHALVDKVNFEGRRAVGVTALVGKKSPARQQLRARREVIVAGGAMASPGILQRSGVGPAKLLESLGIPVVHDSPEVGRNLKEHRAIIAQWKLNNDLSENKQYTGWRLLKNVMAYFIKGSGPMASGAYEVGAWFKSSEQLARPDIQFLVAPFSFDLASNREKLEPFPGMTIVAYPLRPTSGGEVHICSTDPAALPSLVPNYRTTSYDRELMVKTVAVAREYTSQSPLKEMIEAETYPGPMMTAHPGFAKISFTGSTATGKRIMASAAEDLKRITLELGGNDACIVLPDVDVDEVAQQLFMGAFFNTAQVCIATKRLYIHDSIYDALRDKLHALAKTLKVGDGSEADSVFGPLQNKPQYQRVKALMAEAKARGLTILEGGPVPDKGYFLPLTLVDNPADDERVVVEEAFGPILPLLRYHDLDEVIARANNSEYGLAGAVWSKDVAKAVEVAKRLETGTVWINQNLQTTPNTPIGGYKHSGIGVENGVDGLMEFTQPKSIFIPKAKPAA